MNFALAILTFASLNNGILPNPSFRSETGSPFVQEVRQQFAEQIQFRGGLKTQQAAISPTGPWSVTDYGRVSVVRDVNGTKLGSGSDLFQLLNGSNEAIVAYYEAHPDADPAFLVVILDWMVTTFGAFYLPIANDISGIGKPGTLGSAIFDEDPSTLLEGVVWLNGDDLYKIPGQEDFYSGLLFGQEFGHRWLSFVKFKDAQNNTREDLLGRDDAHWSFYLDSNWSWLEGNDWIDNGDGTFTTDVNSFEATTHYSDLDLYLMGFLSSSEVADMTLITPTLSSAPPVQSSPDAWGGGSTTVEGTTETVTMQMILDAEGERVPSSVDSQKKFELAVVYLHRKTDEVTEGELASLEVTLDRFKNLWETDVRGLATVDFVFSGTPNGPPEISVVFPLGGDVGEELTFDATGSQDPEGYALTYIWDFGDGDPVVTSEPVVTHSFNTSGTKHVELRLADEQSAENLAKATVEVTGEAQGCSCVMGPESKGRPLFSILSWMLLVATFVCLRRKSRS